MKEEYPEETNRYKRAWIWLWYNDITRIICMMGIPVLPFVILMVVLGVPGEAIRFIAGLLYVSMIGVMLIFNNYSNLRRIGMDEHRNPLKDKEKPPWLAN